MEIGVQNGGSLEIWAKYFAQADLVLGCDINEACGNLEFEDSRISVVVGDVNHDETQARISAASSEFGFIIDDGSHTSGDIIRTFASLFPLVAVGGCYIVEDLHCSYWDEFDGGLFHPYSSMAFFKVLADIINQEHWGLGKKAESLFEGFESFHGTIGGCVSLDSVHSIEFSDSMCVVKKRSHNKNLLGRRVISGQDERVCEGHLQIPQDQRLIIPNQSNNPWSQQKHQPPESELDCRAKLEDQSQHLKQLRKTSKQQDAKIHELSEEIRKRDLELYRLRNSVSWRLTSPLRTLWKLSHFDEEYYLRQNPDVAQAGVDAFQHYETRGRMEGRHPAPQAFPGNKLVKTEGAGWYTRFIDYTRRCARSAYRRIAKFDAEPSRSGDAIPTQNENDYKEWIECYDTLTDEKRKRLRRASSDLSVKPLISILMPTYNSNIPWLKIAIDSVLNQVYEHWELCIADDASTSDE